MTLDYGALGFKAGLEIHQQLATRKLFCRCPSGLDESDEADVDVVRTLRPTASELGEVDRAAIEEARKDLAFTYKGAHTTACLVELDEEPPHALTPEAVDVAMTVAALLNARLVDEVHVMRKIVIDGSNTSGFQRTALLALDGKVESSQGPVGVATICLEEDSARRLDRKARVQAYRLDRLGIPLVEIATTPDIRGPEHAREVAEAIGAALRATRRVKRGIGTIRQDLNVSIREGARVELKGVQDLRVVPVAIEYEVRRQVKLVEVARELAARDGSSIESRLRHAPVVDVTESFSKTDAKTIRGSTSAGGVVLGLALPGFAGLLGRKSDSAAPEPRFGREIADHARVKAGVKGIFHSDELPGYGVTDAEVAAVRARLSAAGRDAFVLVAAPKPVAERALEAVRERALAAFKGVPEETREALDDGSSAYLRPLPGGARMYPETDVPPFRITREVVARIEATLPETTTERLARWAVELADLSEDQRRTLARSEIADDFEAAARSTGLVREAARIYLQTLPELERQGAPVAALTKARVEDALRHIKAASLPREAWEAMLREMATSGKSAAAAAGGAAAVVGDAEIVAEIERLLDERAEFVKQRGLAGVGPLMGPLMAKFKGAVAGDRLSALLKRSIEARLR